MRRSKGIVCILLAFVMILSSSVATFALNFTDVPSSSPYNEAIYTLADFKILLGDAGSNTFRPDANISREEFSVIMTRVLGLGALNITVDSYPFTDVTPETCDDWSIKATKLAYDLGIIKGMGDGTFAPKDNVTYEQAVKMVVCALGYESAAVEQGGWPNGYMMIAINKGLTKKIDMLQTAPAPRGVIAQLIYNSLEVDLMEQIKGGEEPKYEVKAGHTLLSDKLQYTKATGVVTGVQGSALTHEGTGIREDEVEIDYTLKFRIGETSAKTYLGQTITYYYKSSDNENILLVARPTDSNTITTLNAENIKLIANQYLEYWEDINDPSNVERLDFTSPQPKVILNGKYTTTVDESLTPYTGEVVAIDNNRDSLIDVLLITSSQIVVVDAVDSANFKIYDKYNQANILTLDPNTPDIIQIKKNNQEVQFASIMKGDVLLISQSQNPSGSKITNVEIVTNKVSGKVTELDDGNYEIGIGDKVYKSSMAYLNYIKNNPSEQIKIDDTVTLYLDNNNNILASSITSIASKTQYGYLAATDVKDDIPRFRIYSQNNQTLTLNGVSKVRIDGTAYSAESVKDKLESTANNTNRDSNAENCTISQLIKYTTNSKNEIDNIYTLHTSGDPDKQLILSAEYNETPVKYISSNKTLGSNVSVDSTTKVFYVPSNRTDYSDYSVKSYSYLVNDRSYQFEAYDSTETGVAKVIVLYGTSGMIPVTDPSAPVAIVDSKTTVQDNGMQVHRLSAYINNIKMNYNAIDTDVLSDFKRGDVIKLSMNAQNKIADAVLIFRPSEPPVEEDRYVTDGKNSGTSEAEFLTVYGTVYSRDDSRMMVSIDEIDNEENLSSENLYVVPFSAGMKYYIYDMTLQTPTITLASLNDIAGYTSSKTGASKVFVYSKSGTTVYAIIIKQ